MLYHESGNSKAFFATLSPTLTRRGRNYQNLRHGILEGPGTFRAGTHNPQMKESFWLIIRLPVILLA